MALVLQVMECGFNESSGSNGRDLPVHAAGADTVEPQGTARSAGGPGSKQSGMPCDAVDFGCGAGNYAVWFAMQGFRMTGIDLSPSALALTANLAEKNGVSIRFVEADLMQDTDRYTAAFDFGYDWEVLHHVFPGDRESYIANVRRMLRPGAIYFSMCFCDSDRAFGGRGKYRKTMSDTTLYFSSEEEIERLFVPYFRVIELNTTEIAGKYRPHMGVVALFECR